MEDNIQTRMDGKEPNVAYSFKEVGENYDHPRKDVISELPSCLTQNS